MCTVCAERETEDSPQNANDYDYTSRPRATHRTATVTVADIRSKTSSHDTKTHTPTAQQKEAAAYYLLRDPCAKKHTRAPAHARTKTPTTQERRCQRRRCGGSSRAPPINAPSLIVTYTPTRTRVHTHTTMRGVGGAKAESSASSTVASSSSSSSCCCCWCRCWCRRCCCRCCRCCCCRRRCCRRGCCRCCCGCNILSRRARVPPSPLSARTRSARNTGDPSPPSTRRAPPRAPSRPQHARGARPLAWRSQPPYAPQR